MSDRATSDRVRWPWKLLIAIGLVWFAGEVAAAHFGSASGWYFFGLLLGAFSIVLVVVWDDRERTR